MKQLINNKLLRRMDSFALIGNKRNKYNLSLGVVQVPPRVHQEFSFTLTKLTHFQIEQAKMAIYPHKLLNGSPNSSNLYPQKCLASNLPSFWPNACIYSAQEEVNQVHHQWDSPLFGWDHSLIDGISSSLVGVHEPSGGAQYTSNNLLECSRNDHK